MVRAVRGHKTGSNQSGVDEYFWGKNKKRKEIYTITASIFTIYFASYVDFREMFCCKLRFIAITLALSVLTAQIRH